MVQLQPVKPKLVTGKLTAVGQIDPFGRGYRVKIYIDDQLYSLVGSPERLTKIVQPLNIGDSVAAEVKEHVWTGRDGQRREDFWIISLKKEVQETLPAADRKKEPDLAEYLWDELQEMKRILRDIRETLYEAKQKKKEGTAS